MKYQVQTLRNAGLEARWSRTRQGAPIIVARNPAARRKHQREVWWAVDNSMWKTMQRTGVLNAFDSHTLLGNYFSVAA